MVEKKASYMRWLTAKLTSAPMVSTSSKGPIRNPAARIAPSISSIPAAPSPRMRIASR